DRQSERRADVNPAGAAFLEKGGGLDDRVAGGDHIVDKDHVLALQLRSQEFVGGNGVTTVYHTGIIQTFVIHTHINAQDIGEINSPSHAALVGADDYEMLIVHVQSVLLVLQLLGES